MTSLHLKKMADITETVELSQAVRDEIDRWAKKFPPEQKQSLVLIGLWRAQEENGGWLSQALMDAVARYLGMPAIAVYEVVSFYSLFETKPIGRYKLSVCTNISCKLCGSHKIVEHLKKRLGVGLGENTPDGKYTLREVECLGACAQAPVLQVNDKTFYGGLTPEKIDQLLDEQLEH